MSETLDAWTLPEPRTPEALVTLRAKSVAEFGIAAYTCDGCERAPICELAFDPYNTDGDCLYDK